MSDLSVLFPKPVQVEVGGKSVQIKPVVLADFELFGKAAGDFLVVMAQGDRAQLYQWAARSAVLLDVLVCCTSLSARRVRRLPVATVVELMYRLVAVNAGFFDQALVKANLLLAGAKSYND